uniref:Uncharacterized protein n=1 Tax=Arundo donax TaxID=35708 RepID=A0A0A8ZZ92_ARUDO
MVLHQNGLFSVRSIYKALINDNVLSTNNFL